MTDTQAIKRDSTKGSNTGALYQKFLQELVRVGFKGEVQLDKASRTVLSTDNSVYELYPQAVIYPKDQEDLVLLLSQLAIPEYHAIAIGPRGGGTGTNGQSLTNGIVVDTSRHLNHIIEINKQEGWAVVESGVVKDQLNAALKERGLFFAPELSTSNRATIGGMISTDASGQGSVIYGKTRDHVIELDTVVLGGEILRSSTLSKDDEQEVLTSDTHSIKHRYVKELARINEEKADEIKAIFPPLNRCLTGYDLAHIRNQQGELDLNSVLCGSEGSLGLLSRAKVRVLPIPKFYSLFVIYYADFMSSLRDANALMDLKPSSIETIDSKVLGLAMNDFVWNSVEPLLPGADPLTVKGMNFLEISCDTQQEHDEMLDRVEHALSADIGIGTGNNIDNQSNNQTSSARLRYSLVSGKEQVDKIWGMRKRAVGLLGNAKGEARPVAFVEDTAVPPEKLADFIAEFRAILDEHQLEYGMFGHVDAGVLHVRPALDFKDPEQVKLAWKISDQIASLTQKYGGLLWGEHGKGIRSSYSPAFFGDLFQELQAIKYLFDPHNQINPGKIATPKQRDEDHASASLIAIDSAPTRGESDRMIPVENWQQFQDAVHCNGNGACHNWQPDDPMCPSWKGTRDRRYTPKARAMLIKQWLRDRKDLLNTKEQGFVGQLIGAPIRLARSMQADASQQSRFDFEVYDSMAKCLACKSCTGQCPIKVDVPEFRARFLSIFHTRYARPVKDYLVASLEKLLPIAAKFPRLYNLGVSSEFGGWTLSKLTGFVDGPAIDKAFRKNDQIPLANVSEFTHMSETDRARSVVIVEDAFYRYFSPQVVFDLYRLLKILGLNAYRLPFTENGKPLHVHGFLKQFEKTAKASAATIRQFNELGVSTCGVDPSMTLTFRNEYAKFLPVAELPHVELIQECIAAKLRLGVAAFPPADTLTPKQVDLYPHCNEQTIAVESLKDWQHVFDAAAVTLNIHRTGCCGMSGTFGHEARNRELSAEIFDLSWRKKLTDAMASSENRIICASGYSCRSQAKRELGAQLPHPVSALASVFAS